MTYSVDLKSARWKRYSRERKKSGRCGVCAYDWKKRGGWLELHHLTYIRTNQERPEDTIPLCDKHHPKGRYTLSQIKADRQAYLFQKGTWIVVSFPFRVLWRLVCWAFRLLCRKTQQH